jgi:ketosteroid isomerase-like protein
MDEREHDVRAIEALVSRQFASLSWNSGATADWTTFAADFFPDATLYPAARPASPQTVPAFVERMKGLARTSLPSFRERALGTEIHVFGNIAVAIAAVEMTENEADANRNVEMMLLVKSEGAWRIVAQAWDRANASNPVPDELLRRRRPMTPT